VIDTSYWDCEVYDGEVCIDSVLTNPLGEWDFIHIDTNEIAIGSWDTTGTLISGWESVDARSLSGYGWDLNIAGIANMPSGEFTHGIAPQQGGLLIKLMADVYNIPDTMTNRTVNILVQHDFLDHFSFARPDGSSIGLVKEEVLDTNYYVCTAWAGDVCLNWQRVSVPPADSVEILVDSTNVLDSLHVFIYDGSLVVDPGFICGDMDASGGDVNIADLTYLVAYLFQGGPDPVPLAAGNIDCSTSEEPNIADLTYMVAYLFSGGPYPCEGPGC